MLHRTRHLFIRQQTSDKRVPGVARVCLAALGNQLLSLKQSLCPASRCREATTLLFYGPSGAISSLQECQQVPQGTLGNLPPSFPKP